MKNLCRLKIFNLMNSRQQKILSAIIEEYTKTAIPAGSQILVDHYDFKVSPATIRNDMTKLEKEGYLYQPHISAGRIPTDKGYRYFVEEIMRDIINLGLFEEKEGHIFCFKLLKRLDSSMTSSPKLRSLIAEAKQHLYYYAVLLQLSMTSISELMSSKIQDVSII